MAARGSESKEKVTQMILDTFPSAFKYEKEIRIPMMENGEEVQIKVTLTAAKTNVESGGEVALPTASPVKAETNAVKVPVEPTAEEKQNVANLLNLLGL